MDFITRFIAELWHIMVESGVWLLGGLLLAGLVHAFVPRAWFMKHLGGRGLGAVGKASLLGIPMPLCSCSVIPVAAGLRRQGAGKGASAAFAISTPQTGEESIPLTWALFGPVFALARPVIAVLTAFLAGAAINALDPDEPATDDVQTVAIEDERPASFRDRLAVAWHHGFVTMMRDLAPWLVAGLIMAALISAALPSGWIAENVGTGLWPKVAMLFVGVPLYICATSSTPLAWSLVAAGLSPGAAIVLLLAGPATNVATMSWVIKDLGIRSLVVYVVVISAVALGSGVLFDAFFADMIVLASRSEAHVHGGDAWGLIRSMGAGAISAGLLWALAMRYWPGKTEPASCCATETGSGTQTSPGSCCDSGKPDIPLAVGGCCGANEKPKDDANSGGCGCRT